VRLEEVDAGADTRIRSTRTFAERVLLERCNVF
jgi:hypothetical protein